MYSTTDFLELYKTLERWAETQYGEDGIIFIENNHHDRNVRQEIRYFRNVRNVLSHNPNGLTKPLLVLTEDFAERFKSLCAKLMTNISQIAVPYNNIYKREMSDKVAATIAIMKERAFSYVPVMNGKKVWGVFSESVVFSMIGDDNIELTDNELKLFQIGKYISQYNENGLYDFIDNNATIDDIRQMFIESINNGRRLDVIYITTTGDNKGDLVGMITVWDITNL